MTRPAAPRAQIEVEHLRLSYGHKEVIHGINFEVFENEILGVIGPAQSGKVREAWPLPNGKRVLVTSDRVSAFDRVLSLHDGRLDA